MRGGLVSSLLGPALALMGCAGRTEDVVSVTLLATPVNAGQIGRAFLVPRGASTDVNIEVSGVPPLFASRPVHLYTFLYQGRCDALPPKPAHALTERVLAQSPRTPGALPPGGPFTVSNTSPLPLDVLLGANYAIVIRTSPADGDVELFCGAVKN
jgi:hypothetical protein